MKKIDSFINSEFNLIREELNIHLKGSFDINQKKQFLVTYIPKEIVFRSNSLLDELINLVFNEAIEHLEKYGVSIQNKFFDADFKTKIKNITSEGNLRLLLEPEVVSFSRDPRVVNGLIAGSSTLVVGSAVTAGFFITSNLVGAIISGIATLVLSVLAYKVTYGKFTEQARNKMQHEIDSFLKTSEQQVKEWLYSIEELFKTEFNQFLDQHQLK